MRRKAGGWLGLAHMARCADPRFGLQTVVREWARTAQAASCSGSAAHAGAGEHQRQFLVLGGAAILILLRELNKGNGFALFFEEFKITIKHIEAVSPQTCQLL